MKLLDRVVELLEQGKPLDGAEQEVRRIHQALESLDALGHAARLVDDLGEAVGLSKGWLRSEVLKGLEATGARTDEGSVEAQNLQ